MKKYISPTTSSVDLHTESVMTAFSTGGGEITGPVGAPSRDEGWTDWDEQESFSSSEETTEE